MVLLKPGLDSSVIPPIVFSTETLTCHPFSLFVSIKYSLLNILSKKLDTTQLSSQGIKPICLPTNANRVAGQENKIAIVTGKPG